LLRRLSISTGSFCLKDIQPSDGREWVVTNGIGGYASLTLLGNNTRKFHGLLVASLQPPTRRWVFVSNLVEKMSVDGRTFFLKNCLRLVRNRVLPEFIYKLDDVTVRKTLWMPHGENTTILRYDVSTDKETCLIFTPILNSRHFYDLTGKESISFSSENNDGCVTFKPSNAEKTLRIKVSGGWYESKGDWVDLRYEVDRVRGEGWQESVFQAGDITVPGKGGAALYLILTIEEKNYDPSFEFEKEVKRREAISRRAGLSEEVFPLLLAADCFIAKRGLLRTILAGYHWFSDWGRDTLISLPGLTLVTKRYELAKEILLTFANYEKDGLIPNAFIDQTSEAIYNTVDASLWFIDRVYQYVKYTNDLRFVERVWEHLVSIIENYKDGTEFGISMDNDYLILHDAGLTWMDAKVDDEFVTPRARKAVEIQALWYNALRIMDVFSKLCRKGEGYGRLAEKVKKSFLSQYDQQYDVVDAKDCSCRPNKIFLASVDFPMINKNLREEIVHDVHDRLLTPYGLRSLAMGEDGYLGTYIGDYNKDLAYHNGTVWPWLLGPFTRAFLKSRNYEKRWRRYAYENFLKPILNSLNEGCIGNLSEIFDGNKPHAPRGCVAQAWSVAEVLRALVEDVYYIRPRFENVFYL